MLLLVTLALLVASAVLLILGFVQDALGFIYLSMVCAGVAALALVVFARLARRRSATLVGAAVAAGAGRPAPEAANGGGEPVPPDGDRADSGRAERRAEEDTAPQPVVSDEADGTPARPDQVSAGTDPAGSWPEDDWSDWGEEVVFPIEGYDDLRVADILPLLTQLQPHQLQEVRDREVSGKARATILDRIDERLNRGGPSPRAAGAQSRSSKPAGVTRSGGGTNGASSSTRATRTRKKAASTDTADPDPSAAGKTTAKKAAAKKAAAKKATRSTTAKRTAGTGPPPAAGSGADPTVGAVTDPATATDAAVDGDAAAPDAGDRRAPGRRST